MLKKPIGIGIESYKDMIDGAYYYVDKTLMIKDLLDYGSKVELFIRPCRFGKTLTLSMIRTFFERELASDGSVVDNRHYFDSRKIMDEGDRYLEHMGKYPVISMSLKSAKQPDFYMAHESLIDEIIKEYVRHNYILDANCLTEAYREKYDAIMNRRAEPIAYAKALAFLSECLKKYHGTNVIILLDEYDVPLENAFFKGFYEQMVDFIRSLFESALKTNNCLKFAVVTGCLRISRESIFAGLNNLKMNFILDNGYAEYFGFTQIEVEEMLAFYDLCDKIDEAKEWYNGYLFGETQVYNPWSIINYVSMAITNTVALPCPYWSNTSSNTAVRELIEKADEAAKGEIEELISGGAVEKPIHEDVTYGEIYENQDNLWNFLFFTGYLKAVSQRLEEETIYLTMTVPNKEVNYIYKNTIRTWFDESVRKVDFQPFYQAMREQDARKMEESINGQLSFSISYYDEGEKFYHGYLLGILSGFGGYRILSNREQGEGRPDILLRPHNPHHQAFVIELKRVKHFAKQSEGCDKALKQIEEKGYATEFIHEGYEKVTCYGMCFCDKYCMIKLEEAGKLNKKKR